MSDASSPTMIEFAATVYKVQTLVDNGIRVTLDLSEGETLTMAKLAECQRFGVGLRIVAVPEKHGDSRDVEQVEARAKRKSRWASSQE